MNLQDHLQQIKKDLGENELWSAMVIGLRLDGGVEVHMTGLMIEEAIASLEGITQGMRARLDDVTDATGSKVN